MPTGKEHEYLLYDPDLDQDNDPLTYNPLNNNEIPIIIRGGPAGLIELDPIAIEIREESLSTDSFNGETPGDRDFRILIEGNSATSEGAKMTTFAASLGVFARVKNNARMGIFCIDFLFC